MTDAFTQQSPNRGRSCVTPYNDPAIDLGRLGRRYNKTTAFAAPPIPLGPKELQAVYWSSDIGRLREGMLVVESGRLRATIVRDW